MDSWPLTILKDWQNTTPLNNFKWTQLWWISESNQIISEDKLRWNNFTIINLKTPKPQKLLFSAIDEVGKYSRVSLLNLHHVLLNAWKCIELWGLLTLDKMATKYFRVEVNLCQKLFFLQNMGRTCYVQKLFWMSETISVRNIPIERLFAYDLSIDSTETKYIQLNIKTQFF